MGLLTRKNWGFKLNLVALGMLLYTVVVSPGYYAKLTGEVFIVTFGVLIALTLIFIGISIWKEDQF
jgi:hypothetical protein